MRICARLRSTGFSLCSVDLPKLKPHRQRYSTTLDLRCDFMQWNELTAATTIWWEIQVNSPHDYCNYGSGAAVLIRSGKRIRSRLRRRNSHVRPAYCSNVRRDNEVGSAHRHPTQYYRRAGCG